MKSSVLELDGLHSLNEFVLVSVDDDMQEVVLDNTQHGHEYNQDYPLCV
jgi:hypothetical protein